MSKQSRSTRLAVKLADRMVRRYELLMKVMTPSLGMEEISRGEFVRRWEQMSIEDRMAEIMRRGDGDMVKGARSVMEDYGSH